MPGYYVINGFALYNIITKAIVIGIFPTFKYFIKISQYSVGEDERNRELEKLPQIHTVLILVFIEGDIDTLPVLFQVLCLITHP